MRPRTRNTILAVVGVVVVLLALGAVPGLLKSGEPYFLTATAVDGDSGGTDRTAINVTDLSERRFPYTSAALAEATADGTGRSAPYWTGPVGLKEAFTHSPFDELSALRSRNAGAAAGDGVYVRDNETLYRLAVTRGDDG